MASKGMSETTDYGLRYTVRYLYDLQRLRIATCNRPGPKGEGSEAKLSDDDQAFLAKLGDSLKSLEGKALYQVGKKLRHIPIATWLRDQKGCGPTMTGVIISEVDITKCNTVSALWSYAGLSVDAEGKAIRRRRGERSSYNPFLKAKMVKVLADSFVRQNSPWRSFYDNYKNRKLNTLTPKCMGCTGKAVEEVKKCKNCAGTGGPAPWGMSDGHRDSAARRYMIKQFLAALWVEWRSQEGLDVRAPYAEEYLGRVHHG